LKPDFITSGIICLILLGINLIASVKFQLGLEKHFFKASFRVTLQLLILGFLLNWIFSITNPILIVMILLVMMINASYHIKKRVTQGYRFAFLDHLISVLLSILPISFVGAFVLHIEPWWNPSFFLPLVGMIIGNALSGVSTGVQTYLLDVHEKKEEVLNWIAYGASVKEASQSIRKRSILLAMNPTLNSMYSMGIVSIPGMMAGQMIGNQAPHDAAVIQIVVMILIFSGTFFGSLIGLILAEKKIFNQEGTLC